MLQLDNIKHTTTTKTKIHKTHIVMVLHLANGFVVILLPQCS